MFESSPPPPVGPPGYPTVVPPPSRQRRWPLTAALTVAGVVIVAITAVMATHLAARQPNSTVPPPATVTVTAKPATAPTPAPLPTAQADRATCNAWVAAGDKIHAASRALSVLPKGSTIVDPQVRDNPELSDAARKAADLYGQAGDALAAGIAPGTTTILDQSAAAAVSALHALSTADATLDAAGGNTYHVVRESADTMDVLCERLAPR